MKCSRHIVAILTILSILVSAQKGYTQTSTPFIGIDSIAGIQDGDSVNINQAYNITVYVKNYIPNSAYFGSINIYYQTDVGQQLGLQSIPIVSENQLSLTPNGTLDTLTGTFTPQPQYFIFGGGITTVVVWPMVTAPSDEPYIIRLYARELTAINEKGANTPELSVFPNPANEQIAVVLKNQNSTIERVRIYSLNGQLLLDEQQLQTDKNYSVLNTASLVGGIYVIEAITKDGAVRKKFVKM